MLDMSRTKGGEREEDFLDDDPAEPADPGLGELREEARLPEPRVRKGFLSGAACAAGSPFSHQGTSGFFSVLAVAGLGSG